MWDFFNGCKYNTLFCVVYYKLGIIGDRLFLLLFVSTRHGE